jgi:outer membrane protein assembly factor BamD (BamD/ComL family)
VQAYREALALRGRDDARALELFREMNRRWPRSPLRHEIDLNVVDALVRIGRRDEAAAEARRFLARHPHSTKADQIRKSLGARQPAPAAIREKPGAR